MLLDGVNISDGCAWFNDETGEAYCYKRDASGHFYTTPECPDEPAGQLLRGHVVVFAKVDLPDA